MEYFPFGETFVEEHHGHDRYSNYKFNGKELDEETGLYYYGARYYDPRISIWYGVDPLTEDYPSTSAYMYTLGNPIIFVDPNGMSTEVADNGDGTFKVVGGNLNDKDRSIYIVKQNDDGKYQRTGDSIGESLTIYSFYNEDKQDGEKEVGWKGTIDINSTESGDLVRGFMKEANDIGLIKYMWNATDNRDYDFKRDGTEENDNREFHHRGSLFSTRDDGTKVFASARDAGNFSAGYIAAQKHLSWGLARKGFDGLEIVKSALGGHFVSGEGRQSTHAQLQGFLKGKYGGIIDSPVK